MMKLPSTDICSPSTRPAAMPVLRERRVMGNLLLEPQPGEPAPRQVHAQFFQQLPLTGDAVEIPQQQDPQQHFRINRRSPRFAVGCTQLLTHKIEADVAVDET